DDPLQTDGSLVMVHASAAGAKRLRFPRRAAVADALSGETLARNVDRLDLSLELGETRLLELR
ncbi:MAG: hypothetical protein ACE5O2_13360, partial [Armatimonadota bacterium]